MMRPLAIAACGAAVLSLGISACDALPAGAAGSPPVASAGGVSAPPAPRGAEPVEPVVPVPARPVLWGYVDGAGMAHFAATQLDSRYSQVLRETDGPRVLHKKAGPEQLLTWLEISPEVRAMQPWVKEASGTYGVDEELLTAVIAVESGYDARAVSPMGAVGLMQLTPDTADRYGTRQERQVPAAERMLDARTNIRTGARMLADLSRRYGDIDIALAAWNAGEGTVRKAGGRMPDIVETQAHVHMVLELYWALLQRHLPRQMKGFTVDTRSSRS